MDACFARTVIMSLEVIPSRAAVAPLRGAAFPHVCVVTGSGSSCSQALSAKLPSCTRASARKMISKREAGGGRREAGGDIAVSLRGGDVRGDWVSGTTPLPRAERQL